MLVVNKFATNNYTVSWHPQYGFACVIIRSMLSEPCTDKPTPDIGGNGHPSTMQQNDLL